MKKQSLIERYEHELIIVLLIIMSASVIALSVLLKAQGETIKDTQVLLQELAESQFNIESNN